MSKGPTMTSSPRMMTMATRHPLFNWQQLSCATYQRFAKRPTR